MDGTGILNLLSVPVTGTRNHSQRYDKSYVKSQVTSFWWDMTLQCPTLSTDLLFGDVEDKQNGKS